MQTNLFRIGIDHVGRFRANRFHNNTGFPFLIGAAFPIFLVTSLVLHGLAGTATTFAQQPSAETHVAQESLDSEQRAQVLELIRNFKSENYQTRALAPKKIAKFGVGAVSLLNQVILEQQSPDTTLGALKTLKAIAKSNISENSLVVEAVLDDLSKHDSPYISEPSTRSLNELAKEIEPVIAKLLARNGAVINENFTSMDGAIFEILIGEKWTGSKKDMMLLRRCPSLHTLEVASEQFDNDVLQALLSVKKLRSLELERATLTNDSIEYFDQFKNLSTLELRYVSVDDEALEWLERLYSLTRLGLIGTRVSDDGKAKLEETFAGDRLDYRRGGFFGVRYNVGTGPCILTEVIEGTGAAKAGLQIGDQIVKFNGGEVAGGDEFRDQVSQCYVGDSIEVEVIREGEAIKVKAKLGTWKM